jgi:ubiquinone/menaquinone biosynthesis C-methylase UbiE
MNMDELRTRYRDEAEVRRAVTAAVDEGLSADEAKAARALFAAEDAVLDVGSGAGRVALGLWELGYRGVLGVDFSRDMVMAARELARKLDYAVPFRVTDLRQLALDDALFDGAVIDAATQAEWGAADTALIAAELARVVRTGGGLLLAGGPAHPVAWTREGWRENPAGEAGPAGWAWRRG